MSYEIEFEDRGQDLTYLTVNAKTGVIVDAGLLSGTFAKGDCIVDMKMLTKNRYVEYTRRNHHLKFKHLMTKLTLNGKILCDVKGTE